MLNKEVQAKMEDVRRAAALPLEAASTIRDWARGRLPLDRLAASVGRYPPREGAELDILKDNLDALRGQISEAVRILQSSGEWIDSLHLESGDHVVCLLPHICKCGCNKCVDYAQSYAKGKWRASKG